MSESERKKCLVCGGRPEFELGFFGNPHSPLCEEVLALRERVTCQGALLERVCGILVDADMMEEFRS